MPQPEGKNIRPPNVSRAKWHLLRTTVRTIPDVVLAVILGQYRSDSAWAGNRGHEETGYFRHVLRVADPVHTLSMARIGAEVIGWGCCMLDS